VDADGVGRVPVLDLEKQPISDKLFIGPLKISPPTLSDELNNTRRVDAMFGNTFALLGYSIPSRAGRAGKTLDVTLYWQSVAKSDKDYTVFLHLLDSSGIVRAQLDMQPRSGAYPTSIWDVGEIVRDDYALELPRDLAPGDYTIGLGMYEYPSLIRLNVTGAAGNPVGDHLTLDETVQVIR
jgi:hypothetical protein